MTAAYDQVVEVGHEKKYDTVVSSGQSALKALLTMTGGAIIVFLTFLGHLWDKGTGSVPAESMLLFIGALGWWISGIFAALLSYGSIFITNCFSSIKWRRSANGAFVVTMLCGIASLVCFLGGSLKAIGAFRSVTALIGP